MLNQVPVSVAHSTRVVVLRHPNSMPCAVWRKRLVRIEVDADGDPSVMGGTPTLGGMGVMRSEDETDFEYDELGDARMMFVGQYQPADATERDNALIPMSMQEALIESVADLGEAGHFMADSGDVVFLDMGMGSLLPFEVVTVTGNINIPPYTRRLALNPRDDLAFLSPPFTA